MTRFTERVLHMHSFKTHFSVPFDSYIQPIRTYIKRLTVHVCNTATGCLYLGLFLKPLWHPQVIWQPLNLVGLDRKTTYYKSCTTWLTSNMSCWFSTILWWSEYKGTSHLIWGDLAVTTLWNQRNPQFYGSPPPLSFTYIEALVVLTKSWSKFSKKAGKLTS